MIDVKYIAKLARLGLTKEEEEKFEKELSSILDFVEKLKEVDTSGVEPMTGGTNLTNVKREDEIRKQGTETREQILKLTPEKKDRFIKVKAVFE